MNLIGGGTNADTNHIPAAIENPMEYLVVSWRAAGTCLLVRDILLLEWYVLMHKRVQTSLNSYLIHQVHLLP